MELVERRRYFVCRYCTSYHFLDAPESHGIRILATPAGGPRCARCTVPLAAAQLDGEQAVHCCAACRGILLPRAAFAHVVQTRRTWATSPPVTPLPMQPSELDRAIRCPRCAQRMETHPYYGPGNVIIDSCAACDLVWLDFGELAQISDAPGRDRGVRKAAPRSEEPIPTVGRGPSTDPAEPVLDVLSWLLD